MRNDICCIGHITLDKVVTPLATKHMPGGTAFYFSNAIRQMDCSFLLLTAVGASEQTVVQELIQQGIVVKSVFSKETVYFENSYSADQNHRTQRVLQTADPFALQHIADLEASIFHLGPLLSEDIPLKLIQQLSDKGLVSLDVQGFLRRVKQQQVHPHDWADKKRALPYIGILKANEQELEALTGCSDIQTGIDRLVDWGAQEIVITLGSKGSILYHTGTLYQIPAYVPRQVVDATGCGDTYMAGYLYQRNRGNDPAVSGHFAAAMSTCKIEQYGPFSGDEAVIQEVLDKSLRSPIGESQFH